MKHKKVLIITLIVLAAIAAVFTGLYGAGYYYFSDARIIEQNWNVVLPSDMKEVYGKSGPTDFQGHGSTYSVYKLKDSSAKILDGVSAAKNADMEQAVTDILNDIGVSKDQYPNFSATYRWKIISQYTYKLYVIFDPDHSLIYLVSNIP